MHPELDNVQLDALGASVIISLTCYLETGGNAMTEEQKQKPPAKEEHPTTDKIWGATVKTWHTATFRANQYRKIVQKKIDLTSVHKKISTAHTDLGKAIDDLHQEGVTSIMTHSEVQEMLEKLDSLRSAAALLEEEIFAIKAEEPPEEIPAEENSDH
jgi:hypothetical protein